MLFKYVPDTYTDDALLVSDVKEYLKITNDADDNVINSIMLAVISHAEKLTGYTIRGGNWFALCYEFSACMELRKTNITEITSIEYVNTNGDTITIDPAAYYLKNNAIYSTIELADGYSWPNDVMSTREPIKVAFTTGVTERYDEIKNAMLRHAAYLYENRGDDSSNPAIGFGDLDFYKATSIPRF